MARRNGSGFVAITCGSWSRNARMCGVSADDSLSNALSTSSRNGVGKSDSTSVRLKYSAHSSATVNPAASPLNAWPLTRHRVRPSSCDRSSNNGKPASSSAWRSRRMVRVVTPASAASSSMVTPLARARSISRRIVHCRTTSVFRGTAAILAIAGSYPPTAYSPTAVRRPLSAGSYLRQLSPTADSRSLPAILVERDAAQQIDVGQHLSGAEHHRRQRIFGQLHRQSRFVAEAPVELFQQGAAAGEDDSAIVDVGGELRRDTFEGVVNRLHDRFDRFGHRRTDLRVGHRHDLGAALREMAALDLHGGFVFEGAGRSDLDLDLLGRPFANQQIVRFPGMLDDRVVELVSGDPDRLAVHNASQRNDGNVGRPTANVDDHVARGFGDR